MGCLLKKLVSVPLGARLLLLEALTRCLLIAKMSRMGIKCYELLTPWRQTQKQLQLTVILLRFETCVPAATLFVS
jgi:hypothetical protein